MSIAHSGGFSLFELVVFIISVAIIYAYAANRFAEFPGQAERANFMAVTSQLQSGVNLEMMAAFGAGRIALLEKFDGVNPMDLMLQAPANYRGVVGSSQASELPRRSWYFDPVTEELVYLINDTAGAYLIINGVAYPTDEFRLKLVSNYSEVDRLSGLPVAIAERDGSEVLEENIRRRFNGIVLRPTTPYRWQGESEEALMAAASAENS
ncbi:MAG: hypothetical protein JKY86_11985 [Gammaproteobacteria bacterium]|nr:hypothetical protein [Gammaproteobacteria bacterium]